MRRLGRRWCSLLVAAVSLGAASCHGSHDSAPPPLTVTTLEPSTFVAFRATPFTVRGSGFARSMRDPLDYTTGVAAATLLSVVLTFRTDDGTPFANGTSAEVQVEGAVISDTEIQGTLPATNAPASGRPRSRSPTRWAAASRPSRSRGSAA